MRITILLASVLLLFFAAVVVAQVQDTVVKPANRAYDTGHCYELEVKMLTAATTIGDPDQSSYLMAADAYHRLDALEQPC